MQLIDLALPQPGFRKFISAWILESGGSCVLVDPGPGAAVETIAGALAGRVPDVILLTHIHVDHAGGAGALLKRYPCARVVVMDAAVEHLIHPERLIAGSRKTLGGLMDLYGPILPVASEQVLPASELAVVLPEFRVVATPGHARHHISFLGAGYLFCGEALGVRFELDSGEVYLRPATPKRFIASRYKESIGRLAEASAVYEAAGSSLTVCFGHYGSEPDAQGCCRRALEQIDSWIGCIDELYGEIGSALVEHSDPWLPRIIEELQQRDPYFSLFSRLPSDIAERERIFIKNTVDGIAAERAANSAA